MLLFRKRNLLTFVVLELQVLLVLKREVSLHDKMKGTLGFLSNLEFVHQSSESIGDWWN